MSHVILSLHSAVSQSHRVSGVRPVRHSQQRSMAVPQCQNGGGHQDPQVISRGVRQGQVPAGGGHHGPVQTPKCCQAAWDCEGETNSKLCHTYTHTYTHTCTYVHIHAHTHTHMCTQTNITYMKHDLAYTETYSLSRVNYLFPNHSIPRVCSE